MQRQMTQSYKFKPLSEWEEYGKEHSYHLYQSIVQLPEDHSLSARFASAIKVPSYSFLSLMTKIGTQLYGTTATIANYFTQHEFDPGNIQMHSVNISEYFQHTKGLLWGGLVALYSPKMAAETYLMRPADPARTYLNKIEAARLYAMMDILHMFFTKHDIDYRACAGTALGARREQGIIRNDDDVDLMLHPDSHNKFAELVNNGTFREETGINIERQAFTGGWQSFYHDSPKGQQGTPTERIGKPFVDIFPGIWRDYGKEKVITYGEDKMYYQARGDHFKAKEWEEKSMMYPFGPTAVNSIRSIDGYLKRCYGPLALKYIARLYPHETYSELWAKPHRFFSIATTQPSPRYLRHTGPAPVEFDQAEYEAMRERSSYIKPTRALNR